jgi:exodeoxyribonuclease V alpha subunit
MLSPLGTGRVALLGEAAYPPALLECLQAADLGEETAFLAWQLAALANDLAPVKKQQLSLLIGQLLIAEAKGHTYLALSPDDVTLLQAIPTLAGPPDHQRTPLIVEDLALYSQRMYYRELRIVAALKARRCTPSAFSPNAIDAALADLCQSSTEPPTKNQQAAIRQLFATTCGILTGGPGTGKTTTALALARCLVRLGVAPDRIALAAPTGKAAGRMEDNVRAGLSGLARPSPADQALALALPTAQTLHRLLAYSSAQGRFRAGPDAPLPYAAVLVDEGSMIDLELMDALCSALPAQTLLILMGDAEQLPSVAAGALFRDLAPLAVRLTQSFRMDPGTASGQALAAAAAAVAEGNAQGLLTKSQVREQTTDLHYQGVERLPATQREALLEAHFSRAYASSAFLDLCRRTYALTGSDFLPQDQPALSSLFTFLGRTRILGITYKRKSGVEHANEFLHDLAGGGPDFLPGEPVIMQRNDYEYNLWNGDQGLMLRTHVPGQTPALTAVFRTRSGFRAYPLTALQGSLSLAYALSVHKAQGSELLEVILLLPEKPSPLLVRELIYTALTRARTSAILCGSDDLLSQGVTDTTQRNTRIATRLGVLPM